MHPDSAFQCNEPVAKVKEISDLSRESGAQVYWARSAVRLAKLMLNSRCSPSSVW